MKKILLLSIFLLNLTPNILDGEFILTNMSRIYAQMYSGEYICEDEWGEFASSVPCDEVFCVSSCTTCGAQNICEDNHECPTETCQTCFEDYLKGTEHSCATQKCLSCGTEYIIAEGHECKVGESYNPGGENIPPGYGNGNNNKNDDDNYIVVTPPIEEDNTGSGKKEEEEELTPCDKVATLNSDSLFLHYQDSLIQDLLEKEGSNTAQETMWYKTINGDYYWSTGTHNSVAPSTDVLNAINGIEITEHFHTHPSGGAIPSGSDIKAIFNDYNRGNIKKDSYNYGIIGIRSITTIYIDSINVFKKFAETANLEETKEEIDELIQNYNSSSEDHSLQGHLNNFIQFVKEKKMGLGFSFAKHKSEFDENDNETIKIEPLQPVNNGEILTFIDC